MDIPFPSLKTPAGYRGPKLSLKTFCHDFIALPPSFSPLSVLTFPLHSHNSVSLSPCGDGSHAVCVASWPDNSCPFFSLNAAAGPGASPLLGHEKHHMDFEPTNVPQRFLISGFSELPQWFAIRGLRSFIDQNQILEEKLDIWFGIIYLHSCQSKPVCFCFIGRTQKKIQVFFNHSKRVNGVQN